MHQNSNFRAKMHRFIAGALMDPVEPSHPVIIKRSIFGLIRVFNRLPQAAVDAKTTKLFQRYLQDCAKHAAKNDASEWQLMLKVG